ncbi:MAG: hypothetical protein GY853_00430 [PVC group bacterium]|nr:hypothetical protein [PVC group bacterium]
MKKQILGLMLICFLSLNCSLFAKDADKEKTVDTDKVVNHIKSNLKNLKTFSATALQRSVVRDMEMQVNAKVYYKMPHNLRAEISMSNGEYQIKHRVVFDGATMWEIELSEEDEVVNAVKSEIDGNTPEGQSMLSQFSQLDQFNQLLIQYDVVSAKEKKMDSRLVYILELKLKEEEKKVFEQMANATENPEASKIIPEKILFYWDKNEKYAIKVETFNPDQEAIGWVDYTDVKVNSTLKDELFTYVPTEDVNVIDITTIEAQAQLLLEDSPEEETDSDK